MKIFIDEASRPKPHEWSAIIQGASLQIQSAPREKRNEGLRIVVQQLLELDRLKNASEVHQS